MAKRIMTAKRKKAAAERKRLFKPDPGWSLQLWEKWKTARLVAPSLQAASILWDTEFNDDERSKLGTDVVKVWRKFGTIGMWLYVRGGTPQQAIVKICIAINNLERNIGDAILRKLGEPNAEAVDGAALLKPPQFCEGEFEQVIRNTMLVVWESRQTVWLNGKHVEIAWGKGGRQWEFFKLIVRKAMIGAILTEKDFDSENGLTLRNIHAIKSRLIKTPGFPEDLAGLILDEWKVGYRLKIESKQIRIFAE